MGVDNLLLGLFDLVAVNPKWIVGGSWHTEGSHVLLIGVVEGADVVRHIEAELVVFVEEHAINGH